ncbi:MAG: hypothetical protein PHF67_03740 [Candidatus Nanoarchaeia archaeon]|nr:hypothetical protein [Candidatus Nanoarchaeia archaeon]
MISQKSIGFAIIGALIGYATGSLQGAIIGGLAGLAISFLR